MRLRSIWASFDNWWFGPTNPATLGLLRILLGLCAVVTLLLTLYVFSDFYSREGYTPGPIVERWLRWDSNTVWQGSELEFKLPFSVPRINLLAGDPSTPYVLAFYLATLGFAVTFTLGIWTRLSGFALALGLLSLQLRNPWLIHSGDSLLRLTVTYLALSPCGAVYSLDWLRKKRASEKTGSALIVPPVRAISQRLIQYQVAIVYLFTAWWKIFGTYWMDGTATWYPSQMHEFKRFWAPEFLDRQPFVAIGTYGTLAVEFLLGTFVFWRPLRKWILLGGLAMHAYIEYRFNIPMFAFIITSCYVAFYEGDEVAAWVKRMKERWLTYRGKASTSPEPHA